MPNKYKRVLLKLSGEALQGANDHGIDTLAVSNYAQEIKPIVDGGCQLSLVIGGGNIFRGLSKAAGDMDRAKADYLGMLATVMNAVAMQDALEKLGLAAKVFTAIPMPQVASTYTVRDAKSALDQGTVCIFAAGTGNPYFTTDTAACLRALEINADVIIKATQVDGVYDSDPRTNTDAKLFKTISYDDVITHNLKVMDSTAIALCKDNKLPIIVFNLHKQGNIAKVIAGEKIGTVVS
ncbi:MAG: UMP kinase [Coriobacteriales bacterium]|nr:UMP kinase [Coriobacteriales bacterium]